MEAPDLGRTGRGESDARSDQRRQARQAAVARRQFPARRLHLVDIENLAGDPLPSLGQVREAQDLYASAWASAQWTRW